MAASPPPASAADILHRVTECLEARLPAAWGIDLEMSPRPSAPDALITLTAPDGQHLLLVAEVKRAFDARALPGALEQLRHFQHTMSEPSKVLFVAGYLPPSARRYLADEGVAYADATGNVRLASDDLRLFIDLSGADRDPWRRPGRPRETLKGMPAARVVRALVDFRPPYSVPELVRLSGSSPGVTYRVVELLAKEGLLERQHRGPVESVAWRRLLERWSRDYGFSRSDSVGSFLLPGDVEQIVPALRSNRDVDYVLSGSFAAHAYAPYAPARVAMIHVAEIHHAARNLGLHPADRGANVLLAYNRRDVAFERTIVVEGVRTAAPSQVAVDLLDGPGRSPSEGMALLDWMEEHEDAWRR